jgi:hypothetical protein
MYVVPDLWHNWPQGEHHGTPNGGRNHHLLEGGVSLNEAPRVSKKLDRRSAGSYTVCTTITRDPAAYATVTGVNLCGLLFRLCLSCAANLKL